MQVNDSRLLKKVFRRVDFILECFCLLGWIAVIVPYDPEVPTYSAENVVNYAGNLIRFAKVN